METLFQVGPKNHKRTLAQAGPSKSHKSEQQQCSSVNNFVPKFVSSLKNNLLKIKAFKKVYR